MKIEIQRQKRKTITLKIINSEKAILKVPKNFNSKHIDEFLQNKRQWINKSIEKIQKQTLFASKFAFNEYVYLFGEKLFKIKCIEERNKYYKTSFFKLVDIAKQLSQKTGIFCKDIIMTDSVRIWGSFNTDKVMKLNFKLLALPKNLVEYVILHELCHAKYMNHSPLFWREVERICKDYKLFKKQLINFGFILKM